MTLARVTLDDVVNRLELGIVNRVLTHPSKSSWHELSVEGSVMYVFWANHRMIFGSVMFCIIITVIVLWFIPVKIKQSLIFFFSKPIIPHVPRFWSSLCNVVVNEVVAHFIVGYHWCSRLFMTHLCEHVANWKGNLCIVEESSSFCFGSRCYNVTQCFTFDKDGAVYILVGSLGLGNERQRTCSLRWALPSTLLYHQVNYLISFIWGC